MSCLSLLFNDNVLLNTYVVNSSNRQETGVRRSPTVYEVYPEMLNDYFLKCKSVYSNCSLLVNQEDMYQHNETFQFSAFIEGEVYLAAYSNKLNAVG